MTVRLSVCVTTYKRAPLLDRTLASLAVQTRLPDELIVSDDYSPDDTAKVVAGWQGRFPSLRYNRNPRNLNMPGNLNAAIGLATGKYIANLHDADEFAPTLLEKWERALDDHPSAGFVFCGVGGWPGPTEFGNGIILHDVPPLTPGRVFFEKYLMHKLSSIVWGTVMARRAAYARLLPFDSTYGFVSDVDMWMRMCLEFDVAYVREPLIILDHSPTPERSLGRVNWVSLENMRKMQAANIHRFFGSEPRRLTRELARHRVVAQRVYLRRLAGRIWHRDRAGLREGLRCCRTVGWPLRLAGALVRG